MKNKALQLGLILVLGTRLWSDIIYLNNGEELEGKVKKIEKNGIQVEIKGKTKKWALNEVQRIEFEKLPPAKELKELKDSLLDSLWRYGADTSAYPTAQWIMLYEKVTYRVKSDLSWEKTTRTIQKLLKPGGRWIASKQFDYLSKSEALKIESAKVIALDGKINWLRDAATREEAIYSECPIYENLHRIRTALPEIPIGGICDVCITQVMPKISVANPFIIEELFRNWEPVEYKTVEIECPTGMELSILKSATIENDSIVNTQMKTKSYRFWKAKSDKIEEENWLPPISDLAPRLMVGLKDTWEDVGDQYYGLISLQLTYGEALINKINELQTAQNIYNFVATEIKPVPITNFNEYSWVPFSIDTVFKNKFGSLPDRVFLLYSMLKKAGFNSYLVLVAPREKGERIKEVTSIAQFPSLIVETEIGDSTYWLCPIDDCTAFGELPQGYQGIVGLKLIPNGSKLVDIPLLNPKKELVDRQTYAKLNIDGSLEAKQTVKLYGNFARKFRSRKVLKPEELEKYFEKEVGAIHPGGALISFKVSDLKNLNEPVYYELEYIIKDYAMKSGDKFLTLNLPGIMYSAEEVGKQDRANPVDFGIKEMGINYIEIELPDEYKIYYIPSQYTHSSEIASYSATFLKRVPNFLKAIFHKSPSVVVFSDKYVRKITRANAEAYYDYKNCIETKAKLAKKWIVLRRK